MNEAKATIINYKKMEQIDTAYQLQPVSNAVIWLMER
jgi:hypothetical protein